MESGGGEWAGVPGQNYTVQTVLVQLVPLPSGNNSSQIPWLGPRKSFQLRACSSHSPAQGVTNQGQETSFESQWVWLWSQSPPSCAGTVVGCRGLEEGGDESHCEFMGPHSYILKIRSAAPAKKLGVSRGDAPHATAQWDQSRSSPGDSVGLAGSSREELPLWWPLGEGPWHRHVPGATSPNVTAGFTPGPRVWLCC